MSEAGWVFRLAQEPTQTVPESSLSAKTQASFPDAAPNIARLGLVTVQDTPQEFQASCSENASFMIFSDLIFQIKL